MRSKEWKQLELFEISPEEMKLLTLIRDMKIMMDDFSREKLELLELKSDLLVHNPKDRNLGLILSEMTYNEDLPVPVGVFYKENKPTYDSMMIDQINKSKNKEVDLQSIIEGPNSWNVK